VTFTVGSATIPRLLVSVAPTMTGGALNKSAQIDRSFNATITPTERFPVAWSYRLDADDDPFSKALPDTLFSANTQDAASIQPPDRLFRVSMVAAITAHASDMGGSLYCLGRAYQSEEDARLGGTSVRYNCREANPILGRWSARPALFAAVQIGVAALQLLAVAKLHETHPKIATAINFATAGFFIGVAIHNTRVAQ